VRMLARELFVFIW